ncbi:uncharacterized protein LOC127144180 [Cucumis melo]|uniref:Uncharacterized protein LOC127144180 n=1 Tax=Cucumis melo TaxID=3656 RepID=A0ABM3KD70_CUCME|nr:uncharacterized protein LOC127144180 [Cucumis melo]
MSVRFCGFGNPNMIVSKEGARIRNVHAMYIEWSLSLGFFTARPIEAHATGEALAEALESGLVKREELFITSKDEDGMLDIDTTMSLETTWHAMDDLASTGLVRSIGIYQELAKKYERSPAQISLRWRIQKDTVDIPKTSKLKRLEENLQVFDFELEEEDMDLIQNIDKKYRTNLVSTLAWDINIYA